VDGHKAAAAVVRDPETGRLELRPAQGFAKATGACVHVVVWYVMPTTNPQEAVCALIRFVYMYFTELARRFTHPSHRIAMRSVCLSLCLSPGTATVFSVVALDVGGKGGKPAFAVLAGRDHDDVRQVRLIFALLYFSSRSPHSIREFPSPPHSTHPIPFTHLPIHPRKQTNKQTNKQPNRRRRPSARRRAWSSPTTASST